MELNTADTVGELSVQMSEDRVLTLGKVLPYKPGVTPRVSLASYEAQPSVSPC